VRVDAHQHFWRLGRGDYAWLTPDLRELHRDYEPHELAPLLARVGIEATVLVQAAATDSETDFLLSLADANSFIAAVVGWVDFAATTTPKRLATLRRHPRFRGVRPMIQDIADSDWMLGDALDDTFRALIDLDLTFDALVRPVHLPNLLRLLDRHPALSVVIDHGAKPAIAAGAFDDWARGIDRIAAHSTACCKLSGLVTEAGAEWRGGGLDRYVNHLLDCFGADRLMWGSDWPVLNLATRYDAWWTETERLLAPASEAERAAILGGTAARFYSITPTRSAP
jgi:L-fuconolactonase